VACHHHPERTPQKQADMVSAVYLSNLLAHQHGRKQESGVIGREIDPVIAAIPKVAGKLAQWHEMAEAIAQEPVSAAGLSQ